MLKTVLAYTHRQRRNRQNAYEIRTHQIVLQVEGWDGVVARKYQRTVWYVVQLVPRRLLTIYIRSKSVSWQYNGN